MIPALSFKKIYYFISQKTIDFSVNLCYNKYIKERNEVLKMSTKKTKHSFNFNMSFSIRPILFVVLVAIAAVLCALRLFGVIALSWWLCTLPLYLPFAVLASCLIGMLIWLSVIIIIEEIRRIFE